MSKKSVSVQTDPQLQISGYASMGAIPPKAIKIEPNVSHDFPEPYPSPAYRRYVSDRQTGRQMSGYDTYGVTTKGETVDFGTKEMGPNEEWIREYPDPTLSQLGQSDPRYRDQHPSEEDLDEAPGTGSRAVYGTYMDQPLYGPTHYETFFLDWQSIGKQYIQQPPSKRPLPIDEESYLMEKGFEFRGILGEGGFGSVWYVNSTRLFKDSNGQYTETPLACKVLNLSDFRSHLISMKESIAKLVREGDFIQSLKHENIVEYYQVYYIHDPETGFPYCRCLLFMELCGGDVKSLIEDIKIKRLDERQAYEMVSGVSAGLMYLHDQNVCHLDLKVTNIMFIKKKIFRFHKMVYKLADFGLSKRFPSEESAKMYGMTGTVRYLPPEVTRNLLGSFSAKPIDIYCLGLALAESLSGIGKFRQMLDELKNWTSLVCAKWGVSSVCADLLNHMTDDNPSKRPTIEEVRQHEWFNINR